MSVWIDRLGRRIVQRRRLLPIGSQGGDVYARVATFEGDPAKVDDAISVVRAEVESGETPEGLEGAKMLMLVNRETGRGLGVTLFDSEEAMRRGDAALNAMNPGASERRTSVEFYEVRCRQSLIRGKEPLGAGPAGSRPLLLPRELGGPARAAVRLPSVVRSDSASRATDEYV